MQRRITIPSHAKVNLSLKVTGKRSDGFHDIRSIFQAIDLLDEITLEVSEKDEIVVTTSLEGLPTDASNLCWRAAEAFKGTFHVSQGVRIHIEKHIPVSAGLGGGSGNAAATLLGLAKLFDIQKARLFPLAEELGSDVPFFLTGYSTALGRGRGELLEELTDMPTYRYILINPGIAISAGWAYQGLGLPLGYRTDEKVALFENDLEKPVFVKYPLIGSLKEELITQGADNALMSGSGSTLFGVFSDEKARQRAFDYFQKKYPDYCVVKAKTFFPEG